MSAQNLGNAIICSVFLAALLAPEQLTAESRSRSPTTPESSAVDINGVPHRQSEYGDRAPWDGDNTKFVQPDYPLGDRARHNEGTGLFRITLDVNTGSVSSVAVLKSTGHGGLDDAAMRAMRLWRWRPHRWKEINTPVTFSLRRTGQQNGSARELTNRATRFYLNGDNASAIKTFNEAIRVDPSLAEAYIMRGSALPCRKTGRQGAGRFH